MLKHLLFVILIVGGGYYYWSTRPVTHGPGEVAPNEPVQKRTFGKENIQYKNYILKPIAEIDMQVRVLSKKQYFSDRKADIIPYDLVFGWGPMSDERNLNQIMIKQSDRYFYWEMTSPPIPRYQMRTHTANMHLIPPNMEVKDQIGKLRKGHVVKIKGYLVNVSSGKDWKLTTSLTREDFGNHSTEILWIKNMEIL